jgi:hypothetical protein
MRAQAPELAASRCLFFAVFLLSSGCGEPWEPGLDEPLLVTSATFKPGMLAAPPQNQTSGSLQVTAVDLPSTVIAPGQRRAISGRSSEGGHALAVQLAGAGSGYWVLPLEGLDPQYPGERAWSAQLSIGHGIAPGMRSLRLATLGADGAPGPSRDAKLCIPTPYPDNFNACDPTLQPPAAVLALAFDRAADLDLEVRRPDGSWIGGKGKGSSSQMGGQLDRDAAAACQDDALLREHIVWDKPLAPGRWALHVRLHRACGQPAVG